MGAIFPLVLKARTMMVEDVGREGGDAYSMNNLGAIAGTVLAGFLLIPSMGGTLTVFAAGLANLIASFSILFLIGRFRVSAAACLVVLSAASVFYLTHYDVRLPFSFYTAEEYGSYPNFKAASEMVASPVFRKEGIEGDVMLFAVDPPVLISNGKFEGGGVPAHRLIAHLAMASHPMPENVLNIGLGSGYTLSAMSEWPAKKITSVEINPSVLEAVERFIKPALFSDRRINHVRADARNFLLLSPDRYDVIVSVPSVPVESASAALITREFFSIAEKRLKPNGLFAQWVDYYILTNEDTRTFIRTFSSVFPHVTVWHAGGIIILIGSKEPFVIRPEDVQNKAEISDPGLRGLFTVGMTPEKVRKARWIEGKLNTDDLPVLEFNATRNLFRGAKAIAEGK
jgi:spermidine synthase